MRLFIVLFFLLFFSVVLAEETGVSVPAGCEMSQSDTGISSVECAFDAGLQEFKDFSVKKEEKACDGKFEMIGGKPSCIKEGTNGFSGTVCPSEQELAGQKVDCSGKIEEFFDATGCNAIRCINEEFAEKLEEKIKQAFPETKAQAIICGKNGGTLSIVNGKEICVGEFVAPLALKEDLGEMKQEQIEATAEKIEKIESILVLSGQKLEKLQESASAQDAEATKVLQQTAEQVSELKEKVAALNESLSVSVKLDSSQKKELLNDLQEIKKTMSMTSLGIVKGEIITNETELKRKFEVYQEYYGRPFTQEEFLANIEKEKGAQEKIRSCEKYSTETSFDPPDPDNMIVLLELLFKDGKCTITLHTSTGKTAKFNVPKEKYSSFSGPESIIDEPCEGEACGFIRQITTQSHGTTPEETCTEKCVFKDCSLGMYACMQKNLTKCEVDCGLKKQGEGPYDSKGQFDPMQACVMMCAGDESMQCKPGGNNPTCNACEAKCIDTYGPGHDYEKCVTEKKLNSLKAECEANNQYSEPVEEFVMTKNCITGVVCRDYPKKNPDAGTSPDNYESGHEPSEQNIVPTGSAVLFDIMEFIKRLFK